MLENDENPGASEPRLEAVNYGGRKATISGDPQTVAGIHRIERTFDLFETITLAILAAVVTSMSALMVIFAPNGRAVLVGTVSITGWILALGLGGYTAFRIKASKSGIVIDGQSITNRRASAM